MFFKRLKKSTRQQDDTSLLRLYAETGELSYLGDLYNRYMHLVYGVCLKYLKEEEASKDAVMHIFEQLIRKLKEDQVSHFKSWLYVVAKNHCLMILRRKQPLNGYEDIHHIPDLGSEDLWPHEPADEDSWSLIERGMLTLPAEQQQCIQLFYLEQKSYNDIVALTGYDLKKVKSYIQNGKRNLKIFVNKHHE